MATRKMRYVEVRLRYGQMEVRRVDLTWFQYFHFPWLQAGAGGFHDGYFAQDAFGQHNLMLFKQDMIVRNINAGLLSGNFHPVGYGFGR
jgi:hypothetical protein